MTRIFIVEPMTGKLLTVEEWKNRAEKKAVFIVIVPGDGSHAFAMANHDIGEYPWKKAKEMVGAMSDTLNNEPFAEWDLPTRKQWIDIREARACGLDQVLEMTGGEKLLRDFRCGEWFWTSDVWVPVGTSAEDYEKKKENASGAWCSSGNSGCAGNGNVCGSYLALPLLLYTFRDSEQ